MKKIVTTLLLLIGIANIYAQSSAAKKPTTLGLHFFYNEFNTQLFNPANTMQGGFGVDYLKGITKKIDAVGTFNASWVNYKLPSTLYFGSSNFLLDLNVGAHIKLVDDSKTFSPFLITKVGYTKYQGFGGFSALPGAGLQINMFNQAFIIATIEYRKAISSAVSNQLYYSVGIASPLATKKVKAPKPIKEKPLPPAKEDPKPEEPKPAPMPVVKELAIRDIIVTVKDEATDLPLQFVTVTLRSSDGVVTTATSNEDGIATFNNTKAGAYTIAGRLNKIDATQVSITNSDFENIGNQIPIQLTHNDPRFTLVGNTVDKKANRPVGGTQVSVTNNTQGSTSFTTSNNADGEFRTQLEGASDFEIVGKKASYISNIETLSTKGLNRSTTLYVKLQLGIEEAKAGQSIVLNKIFFASGSAALNTTTSADLKKLVLFLKDNPATTLEIQGHTDNVGSLALNLSLSQQRANSVVNYLVRNGINKAKLIAKGYGPKQPIATNTTEAGKAKNRRVEMKVVE
jgi:outer membrane protein OmpA-like peptidoglycan-associated protein